MNKRIVYYSKCNADRKCSFAILRYADYHPGHPMGEYRRAERGKHFFADPVSHGFQRPPDDYWKLNYENERMSLVGGNHVN